MLCSWSSHETKDVLEGLRSARKAFFSKIKWRREKAMKYQNTHPRSHIVPSGIHQNQLITWVNQARKSDDLCCRLSEGRVTDPV
jgi:hypothetical protein